MATLSLNKGDDSDAIAIVKGGDYDGEILYLHHKGAGAGKGPKKEINSMKYMKDLKGIKTSERVKLLNKMSEALSKDEDELKDVPPEHNAIYKKILSDMKSDKGVELPDDSTFQCIHTPDPKTRQIWYCAGISGSGKSHFARGVAESYKRLFPDREVYLISKLKEDETLDNLKINGKLCPPKRIDVQSLVNDYPTIEEFTDCLLILDDYDTFDKKEYDVVQKLIDDLAIQGRHTNTSMLVLSHYLTNYKKTRLILQEAHTLVLYPQATSFKALKYVLENYGGLDKEQVHALRKLGRWIAVKKTFPAYVISAHKAYPIVH